MSGEATDQPLFAYGTLQQVDVQLSTFGRLLSGGPGANAGVGVKCQGKVLTGLFRPSPSLSFFPVRLPGFPTGTIVRGSCRER